MLVALRAPVPPELVPDGALPPSPHFGRRSCGGFALEQQTDRHSRDRAGDTDRHWQLGPEGARRVLGRTSQTGTTRPLSQLSAEMADRVLGQSRAKRPAPVVEDLPTVMVDPALQAEIPSEPPTAPKPSRPRGWMFAPESNGRPSVVDADELRAATARPFGGLVLWMRKLFTS